MIECRDIWYAYGTEPILRAVDFTIPAGAAVLLEGPNGAGKSTLLTMIGRLLGMDSGAIEIAGYDVASTNSRDLAKIVSVLRQENHFVTRLTVRQLVGFGRFPYSQGRLTVEDEEKISEAIDFLDMTELEGRYLDQLSGGQRQRAYVAMVLCQDTDYVLLAEDDCMIWEHLRGENLEKQLKRALDLLISGQADMVRLRHAWRGCTRYKAAYTYSYFYPVEQLATMWVHAEGLSEAPDWIKSIRRFFHPLRSKRSIGRCVYVEQNPHLCFPQYITKIDEGYIIDSEVFQWTNQPTLIARSRIRQILTGLEQMSGSIGKLPQDFEHAVNSPRWRNAHMNIGVIRGIFT